VGFRFRARKTGGAAYSLRMGTTRWTRKWNFAR